MNPLQKVIVLENKILLKLLLVKEVTNKKCATGVIFRIILMGPSHRRLDYLTKKAVSVLASNSKTSSGFSCMVFSSTFNNGVGSLDFCFLLNLSFLVLSSYF